MKKTITHITHPGELLKREIIVANKLSISAVSEMLGVTRAALSNLLNEKAAISPMMALRIEKVFGGNAELWIRMQATYDLRMAEKKIKTIKLKPYKFELV
ncbi:MAG: HigA family addiction module antitoxin [Bacteroidota bacterium]